MHAVVAIRSLGQRLVSLTEVPAPSQRHVAHQQQPGAVRLAGFGVFQTGAADAGEHSCRHLGSRSVAEHQTVSVLMELGFSTNLTASLK